MAEEKPQNVSSLHDVKNKMEKAGHEILSYNGHTLVTNIGVFSICHSNLFLNGSIVVSKEMYKKIVGDE